MSESYVTQGARYARIPVWLLDRDISDRAIRLYAVLSGHYAGMPDIYPSRRALAEQMGCSVDTVDRGIAELVKAGALAVETRKGDDGRQTSNRYDLAFERPHRCGGGGAYLPPSGAADMRRTGAASVRHKPDRQEPARQEPASSARTRDWQTPDESETTPALLVETEQVGRHRLQGERLELYRSLLFVYGQRGPRPDERDELAYLCATEALEVIEAARDGCYAARMRPYIGNLRRFLPRDPVPTNDGTGVRLGFDDRPRKVHPPQFLRPLRPEDMQQPDTLIEKIRAGQAVGGA